MAELVGDIAETVGEAANIATKIGYPVIVSPVFCFSDQRVVRNISELREAARELLRLAPTGEIAVEKARQ